MGRLYITFASNPEDVYFVFAPVSSFLLNFPKKGGETAGIIHQLLDMRSCVQNKFPHPLHVPGLNILCFNAGRGMVALIISLANRDIGIIMGARCGGVRKKGNQKNSTDAKNAVFPFHEQFFSFFICAFILNYLLAFGQIFIRVYHKYTPFVILGTRNGKIGEY